MFVDLCCIMLSSYGGHKHKCRYGGHKHFGISYKVEFPERLAPAELRPRLQRKARDLEPIAKGLIEAPRSRPAAANRAARLAKAAKARDRPQPKMARIA